MKLIGGVRACAKCKTTGYIIESSIHSTGFMWRRRSCPACKWRWSTLELPIDLALEWMATANLYAALDLDSNT